MVGSAKRAACSPVSMPRPPASTPIKRTPAVGQEGVENADGVAAAADAGDNRIGQLARPAGLRIQHLPARFGADDALEVAHDGRVGVRPQRRAEQIVRRAHVGHPIADGLVDGVFEGFAAALDPDHLSAQQPHAKDVGRLAGHVDGAHVDHALDAEQRGRGRGGDAVLAGAGFGDDTLFAHALHQQRLSQRVIDLVRA